MLEQIAEWPGLAANYLIHIDIGVLVENKIARAIGMMVLVFATIWVIALVYNGYAQDSIIGPVAVRPHTNKRLSDSVIVFDQSKYPFQMDGVEATCRVFYQYEDAAGKTQRIPVLSRRTLKMHIRVSPIPVDPATTQFGFETKDDLGVLPQASVIYPNFETQIIPDVIAPTPTTIGEYIAQNQLETYWKEDDEAPVISLHPVHVDLIAEARKAHIVDRANKWSESQKRGLLNRMSQAKATRERANVFGSYYIKMQFSKRPDFVLFKHPNKELKMTAWLTLLTSVFSLAMDLWPVEHQSTQTRHVEAQQEHAPSVRRVPPAGP